MYIATNLIFTVKVTNEMVEKWTGNQTSAISAGFQQKGVLHIILSNNVSYCLFSLHIIHSVTADQWKTQYYLKLNSYYISNISLHNQCSIYMTEC